MNKISDGTHEWRKLREFVDGDSICIFSKNCLVTKVIAQGRLTRLVYIMDEKEEFLVNTSNAEYCAQKREHKVSLANEESNEQSTQDQKKPENLILAPVGDVFSSDAIGTPASVQKSSTARTSKKKSPLESSDTAKSQKDSQDAPNRSPEIIPIVANREGFEKGLAEPILAFEGSSPVMREGNEHAYEMVFHRLVNEGYEIVNWDKKVARIRRGRVFISIDVASLVGMSRISSGMAFVRLLQQAFQIYAKTMMAMQKK